MNATAIQFHYQSDRFHFPERNRMKEFLLRLLKKEGKKVEHINYIFCTDAYLLELNRQYLKHDTYTDIITFELSEANQPLLADIYISIDRIRQNAQKFETSFSRELQRVIFHGALHLCGYKDKTASDAQLMRKKEDQYLGLY